MKRGILARTLFLLSAISLLSAIPVYALESIDLDFSCTIPSGEVYSTVNVYDNPFDPLDHTTVEFYGQTNNLNTNGSSAVEFYGFVDQSLTTHNSSTFNIRNGGSLTGAFSIYDSSIINVYQGGQFGYSSFDELYLLNSATLNIQDGSVGALLLARNSSVVNLYSGDCRTGFELLNDSIMNIYGGSVGAFMVNNSIASTATLNIYGYGFVYNPQWFWFYIDDPANGWWISRLTGFDLNGNPVAYEGIPDPYTNSNINLIPEPATALLLGLGMIILRKRKTLSE
jgi:hypothetical protein